MAERLTSLEAVLLEVWQQLALASHDKQHAWRCPVLATRCDDGVDARTVVLREVRRDPPVLMFYTDPRADKVRQFHQHPQGTLVLWSQPLGWQLRIRVSLEVQTSGLDVTSRWAQLKLSPAAQDYLAPLPPGSVLNEPGGATPASDASVLEPPHRVLASPERQEFFGVINAQVQSMDWLELHPQGHRRARFDALGARWLQP